MVKCLKCKFIQVTAARKLRCRNCGYSGKEFKIYGEFDEDWEATAFIQKLKEALFKE